MTKIDTRLSRLPDLIEQARAANAGAAGIAVADFEAALKRIVKRASVPANMERVEFAQHGGPTIEFTGSLLASQEFTTDAGLNISLEIWRADTGALVAAEIVEGEGEYVRALVVPAHEDHQAMRAAVMEFFNWSARARNMARKLGWSLRQEVE